MCNLPEMLLLSSPVVDPGSDVDLDVESELWSISLGMIRKEEGGGVSIYRLIFLV